MIADLLTFAIDNASIDIAHLRQRYGRTRLVNRWQIPRDQDHPLQEALAATRTAPQMPARARAWFTLTPDFFSCRNLTLPLTDPRKAAAALPYAVEPLLASPADTFHIRGIHRQTDDSGCELLAACLPRTIVQQITDFCRLHQLDLQAIRPRFLALADTVAGSSASQNCGILFQETNNITFYLFSRQRPLAFRNLPRTEHNRTALLDPFVQQTMASVAATPPSRLFLVGEPPISEACLAEGCTSRQLSLADLTPKTRLLDPASLADPVTLDGILNVTHDNDTLRTCNFSPQADPAGRGRALRLVRMAAIYTSVILLLGLANYLVRLQTLTNQAAVLQDRIATLFHATLPAGTRMVDPLQQFTTALNRQQTPGNPSGPAAQPAGRLLKAIFNAVPRSLPVQFTSLVLHEQRDALLQGRTDSFNNVEQLKEQLLSDTPFTEAVITSADLAPSGNAISFELQLR